MPRGGPLPIAGYEDLLIIPVTRSRCVEGVVRPNLTMQHAVCDGS